MSEPKQAQSKTLTRAPVALLRGGLDPGSTWAVGNSFFGVDGITLVGGIQASDAPNSNDTCYPYYSTKRHVVAVN